MPVDNNAQAVLTVLFARAIQVRLTPARFTNSLSKYIREKFEFRGADRSYPAGLSRLRGAQA